MDIKFIRIENIFYTGRIQEALREIESIEQNTESSYKDKVVCKTLKSKLYFFYQPFSKAIKFGEEALKGSIKTGDDFLIFDSAFHYGRALCITGIIDVGAKNLQLAEDTLSRIQDKESPEFLVRKAWILGHYKGWRGGFEILLERLTQALEIVERIDHSYMRANILYELASLYQWYGDHHNFKKYLLVCLELAEKYGYQEYIMWCLKGLGTIDLYKGNLIEAFDNFEKSHRIAVRLESSYALSFILGEIGFLYWHKQDEASALKYYDECIKGLQDSDNTIHRQYPWILFRSILVLLEQGKYNEAKAKQEIIQSISELQNYRSQHLSHKLAKLSKAIVLKTVSLETNFQEITKLLEETAYDKLVHDELNKIALYHLCDLYFRQLIQSNDLRFLDTIKLRVKDLEIMAKQQESSVLLAEALLFESQLALLELEIDNAKLLLLDAQKIAEEKEIYRLANLISNAYDTLLDNIDQWETASSLLPDIANRMELTHIEELLHHLIRNKIIYSNIEKEEEDPMTFIMLNDKNSLIYSEVFDESIMNIEILNGIIPLIQSVITKYKCVNPVFERVRHKDYTLLVDKYKEHIFCYVFIGKSYSAHVKFQKIMREVQNSSDIWQSILPKLENKQKLTSHDRFQLTSYLHRVYSK